jgi:tRNA(Ile)-lysidine synthase
VDKKPPHQAPIIVGVSGGADSLCLLGTLYEQGYSLIVAHFDHQLRHESVEDVKFVESIAAHYKLPFVSESDDVTAYAKSQKQTIEEAARNLRYRFLFSQARKYKAQSVAVGHTADDQVETVLMHFLRGAGLSGLKGIQPQTILPAFDPQIPLVRPILNLWRADTVAYCAAHDLVPHEDPSNASDDFFRNRLRHHLIPELEKYNPRFRESLQRTSHTLSGDHALLAELIDRTWQEIVIAETENHTSFHLSSFAKLSPALMRNLIKYAVEKLRPGQMDISFSTLERATQFISSPDSAQRIDLASGLVLFKEEDVLYLTDSPSTLPLDSFPQMGVDIQPFSLPCEIDLGAGWALKGKMLKTAPMLENDDPFQVTLDADTLSEELTLRSRRAGDKFQPLGMEGRSMKVKDFFINVKLLRRARDRYPLLCVDDEIVWIPGYRPAQRVRVTDSTQRVASFWLTKS